MFVFGKKDTNHAQYSNLRYEVAGFTECPKEDTEHISYNQNLGCYELKDKGFGFLTFKLLSDIVCDQDVKEKLLSDSRYHECHPNAILVARSLKPKDKESTYVVGGKLKGLKVLKLIVSVIMYLD